MVEISQIEHSFYPTDGYFEKLIPTEQELVNNFMSQKRVMRWPVADFDKHQTIGFAGEMIDRYGQVVVDVQFIVEGHQIFSSGQIFTGESLSGLLSLHFFRR